MQYFLLKTWGAPHILAEKIMTLFWNQYFWKCKISLTNDIKFWTTGPEMANLSENYFLHSFSLYWALPNATCKSVFSSAVWFPDNLCGGISSWPTLLFTQQHHRDQIWCHEIYHWYEETSGRKTTRYRYDQIDGKIYRGSYTLLHHWDGSNGSQNMFLWRNTANYYLLIILITPSYLEHLRLQIDNQNLTCKCIENIVQTIILCR